MERRTRHKSLLVTYCLLFLLSATSSGAGGAFDQVVDDPKLPRVLLVGDSISIDYTPDTRDMLKGIANVHRPSCNCMYSSYVAENIEKWLGGEKWDIVHFNAGIWDCHFIDENGNMMTGFSGDYYDQSKIRTTPAQYKENLNKIINAIIEAGATPIFATTTDIPRWNDKRRTDIKKLNKIAENLMFYKQVQIDDLYSFSLPHLKEWQLDDQVHFNTLGRKELAKQVSSAIIKALGLETKILEWSVEKTNQPSIEGRNIVRCDHDCLEKWGYDKGRQNYFYVAQAKMKLEKNPLVVFLHSAGGDAGKELNGNVKFVAEYGDEFVGLMLNSIHNLDPALNGCSEYDWWWGEKAIARQPDKYADKMTPTETRVLETIEWVVQNYNIDRNRIYLRGISMGGSGTLGIGLSHGDIFAAIQADVFAGVDHALYRLKNASAEPPYAIMLLSQLDTWSKGAEQLFDIASTDYLPMIYAWDVYGHNHQMHYEKSNQAVVNFPWLSLRRNEAYPVFTNTSANDKYPGHMSKAADQHGQVNAYFRWSILEDSVDKFVIELRTVNRLQFVTNATLNSSELNELRQSITSDVTLRRLQNFKVTNQVEQKYNWAIEENGKLKSTGRISPNEKGLLTINGVEIDLSPIRLVITLP